MNTYFLQFKESTSHSFTHKCNGVVLRINIVYNSYDNSYFLNIDRLVNGKYENIINNIHMNTGADLFNQFKYYNLGHFYIIPSKETLYNKNPSAKDLKDYYIMWEHE